MPLKWTGPRCKPLVTGQLVQYNGMDDDGFFERGYPRRYFLLTLGQYAGTTNITVNAKVIAMENGCVMDRCTGLMWMRYTPDSDIGPGNDGELYWVDAVNNEDIFEFCDQANAQNLAGHSDWRVPNIFELFSLIVMDVGIGAPYIDTDYFQCVSDYYWSSTTLPADTTYAAIVQFGAGSSATRYYNEKITVANYVRLVRRG